MRSCWQVLGLPRQSGADDVRRAYASLIRVHRPDGDPQAFSEVREAYEEAMAHVRWDAEEAASREAEEAEEASQPAALVMEEALSIQVMEEMVAADALAEPGPVIHVEAPVPEAETEATAQERFESSAEEARQRAMQIVNAPAGEGAALLRTHTAWLAQQDIDAQLDFDSWILSAFSRHPSPDLTTLLDAALHFRWDERAQDIEQVIGQYWSDQLAARIELARQTVYAQNFSSNAWTRRLLGGESLGRAWVGLRPDMLAAEGFAAHWESLREKASLDGDAINIRPEVLRRMRSAIPSTDLIAACFMALVQWSRYIDGTLAWVAPLAWFLAILGLCALNRWLMRFAVYRKVTAWLIPEGLWQTIGVGVASAVILMFGFGMAENGDPFIIKIVGYALMAAAGAALAALWARFFWRVFAMMEQVVFAPWTRSRQASDMYLFNQAMQGALPLASRPPLGMRLRNFPRAWKVSVERMRAERKATAEQEKERKRMGIQGPSFLRQYWIPILVFSLIIIGNLAKLLK